MISEKSKRKTNFFKYARLYRGDVAAVTFFSAMGGYLVAGKALDFSAFFKGIFISLVVYNFVYVLNSVTDIGEDSLNKPHRPIPSGDLNKKDAEKYLILLLFVSVIMIPILFKGAALFFMFLVIFLGIIYSVPPFQLKRYSFSAIFITAWGMTNPFLVTGGTGVFTAFTGITFTSLAVVIFKDISDEKGDRKAGRKIITDKLPL
ncbi:MAG: UbiA family prenyltransferase, partial [bacterium]